MHRYIPNEDDPGGPRLRGCQQGGVALADAKGLHRSRAEPGSDLQQRFHPPVVPSFEDGQERASYICKLKSCVRRGCGGQHIPGEEPHLHGEKRQAEAEPAWEQVQEITIKTAGAAELTPSPPRFPISLTPRVQFSPSIPYSVSNFNTEPRWVSSSHCECAHACSRPHFQLVATKTVFQQETQKAKDHHIIQQQHELGFTFSDIKGFFKSSLHIVQIHQLL